LSIEEQHVALPKLYGAPAYARPAPIAEPTPRPFDRDELPLEAVMTDEERDIAEHMPARAYATISYAPETETAGPSGNSARIGARPFRLKAIAGRILKSD
jgi:hypothetical protein